MLGTHQSLVAHDSSNPGSGAPALPAPQLAMLRCRRISPGVFYPLQGHPWGAQRRRVPLPAGQVSGSQPWQGTQVVQGGLPGRRRLQRLWAGHHVRQAGN